MSTDNVVADDSSRKAKKIFYVFIGLLALSCTGVITRLLESCIYSGCTDFLGDAAHSSQNIFLVLSGIKTIVAMVEDVPIVGKMVEALSDLIDYTWWGSFMSMIVLRIVQLFFKLLEWFGVWPSVILSLCGCVLSGMYQHGIKVQWVRKVLLAIGAFILAFFFITPVGVRGVSVIAKTLEAQRGNKLEQARDNFERTWTKDNFPNYFDKWMTELGHSFPRWTGGLSEEEYQKRINDFEAKELAFKKKNEAAINDLTEASIIFLAEKVLVCFLFPFALLWGTSFFTKKMAKVLELPFEVDMKRLMQPPEKLKTATLQKKAKEIKQSLKNKRKAKRGVKATALVCDEALEEKTVVYEGCQEEENNPQQIQEDGPQSTPMQSLLEEAEGHE